MSNLVHVQIRITRPKFQYRFLFFERLGAASWAGESCALLLAVDGSDVIDLLSDKIKTATNGLQLSLGMKFSTVTSGEHESLQQVRGSSGLGFDTERSSDTASCRNNQTSAIAGR